MPKVSIHQPNFLPWLGFFEKIVSSELYVVLDHVQPSLSSDFLNRVMLNGAHGNYWMTLPISKSERLNPISGIFIDLEECKAQIVRHVEGHFGKNGDCFNRYIKQLEGFNCLTDLNLDLIGHLAEMMDVKLPPIVRSSELNILATEKTLALIEILEKVEASSYLTGLGARNYLDVNEFHQRGIKLEIHDFMRQVAIKYSKPQCSALQYIIESRNVYPAHRK